MHRLERRLHSRDESLRNELPFEWGLEHLSISDDGTPAAEQLTEFTRASIRASQQFFSPPPIADSNFDFDGHWLSFPSSIESSFAENNIVSGRYFPAGNGKAAVILAPHWNAQADSYVALCKTLNRFGVSVLRLSLPYHDRRTPAGRTRADLMVSPNLGLTIQAVRQAVQDVRRAADWLFLRGKERIAVMGTSIGSCVSWLAFVHDRRLAAGAFNLVSSYFGDVVWRGLTTSHIRRRLETATLSAEDARNAWLSISPSVYTHLLKGDTRPMMMISARYDLTFLPDLAQILFDGCTAEGVNFRKVMLSCGHYTIGRTPFKYIDGYHLVRFLSSIR